MSAAVWATAGRGGDLLPAPATARRDHLRGHVAALAFGVAPLSRRGGLRSSVLGFACGRRGPSDSGCAGLRPNEGPELLGEPRTMELCRSRAPSRAGSEWLRNMRSLSRACGAVGTHALPHARVRGAAAGLRATRTGHLEIPVIFAARTDQRPIRAMNRSTDAAPGALLACSW